MPKLGTQPIDAEYVEQMNRLAKVLDEYFNGQAKGKARKTGFVLLVFPVGSTLGRCNYISNAERKEVVTMMKDQLAYFEGQAEMSGTA